MRTTAGFGENDQPGCGRGLHFRRRRCTTETRHVVFEDALCEYDEKVMRKWIDLLPTEGCCGPMVYRRFRRGSVAMGTAEKEWLIDATLLPAIEEREHDPSTWRQELVRGWVFDVRGDGRAWVLERRIDPKPSQGPSVGERRQVPGVAWGALGWVRVPRDAEVAQLSLAVPEEEGATAAGCCLSQAVMFQIDTERSEMQSVHAVLGRFAPTLPDILPEYTWLSALEGQ